MLTQPEFDLSPPRSDTNDISKSGISDSSRSFLYPEEVEILIKAAKKNPRNGTRDALAILMSYRHGLRVSELVSLRWSDIDWKSSRLYIKRSKNSNDGYHPLYPEETRPLKILQKQVTLLEKKRGFAIPWIFCSEQARKMDSSTFRKLLYSLSESLEVKARPHMLRHSCGFYLINKGVDIRTIQQYLGHVNISNTVRYTHLSSTRFEKLWD